MAMNGKSVLMERAGREAQNSELTFRLNLLQLRTQRTLFTLIPYLIPFSTGDYMNAKTLDSRRTREQWREVLDKVTTGEGDIVVTRNKKPTVAIIPYEDYALVLEQLDAIRAERLAATLYQQWQQGRIAAVPWSEAKQRLAEQDNADSDNLGSSDESAGEDS
jgi:prevent-host-death family protein